jgi:hypothetical protein
MPHRPSDVLANALQLARLGVLVFPCHADKRPATPNGFYDATTDARLIRSMQWHGRLVAMPTGTASGFSVLDVDFARHPEARTWFREHSDRLPETYLVETRSGGGHVYFRHDGRVRNSVGRIARGIDVRGKGGLAILWDPEGFAAWLEADHPIAMWPDWLRVPEPARRAASAPRGTSNGTTVADASRGAGLIAFVEKSVEGERNARLFWAACRLAGLWFPRERDRDAAIDALRDAAISTGLEEDEVIRTIESAFARVAQDQGEERSDYA